MIPTSTHTESVNYDKVTSNCKHIHNLNTEML